MPTDLRRWVRNAREMAVVARGIESRAAGIKSFKISVDIFARMAYNLVVRRDLMMARHNATKFLSVLSTESLRFLAGKEVI